MALKNTTPKRSVSFCLAVCAVNAESCPAPGKNSELDFSEQPDCSSCLKYMKRQKAISKYLSSERAYSRADLLIIRSSGKAIAWWWDGQWPVMMGYFWESRLSLWDLNSVSLLCTQLMLRFWELFYKSMLNRIRTCFSKSMFCLHFWGLQSLCTMHDTSCAFAGALQLEYYFRLC